MRYLLLILFFALQTVGYGINTAGLKENSFKKTLTLEKTVLKARSYDCFRYYSTNTGTYISQDPIRLAGSNPNLYAYVPDSNAFVDVLGLNPIVVIGENQAAVNEATKLLRDAGYNAESMQVPKNQWEFPERLTPRNIDAAAEWNKTWMTDKINQGYDIFDIGFDSERSKRSKFYAKELEALSETKGTGKGIKIKKFPNGENVGDMRKRIKGCR